LMRLTLPIKWDEYQEYIKMAEDQESIKFMGVYAA
jgi:hypothetical protein